MTTELTQKLENIISGHSINEDDADWLRALTAAQPAQAGEVQQRLFQLLNGAAGDGLIINDIDAAELFTDLFPEHIEFITRGGVGPTQPAAQATPEPCQSCGGEATHEASPDETSHPGAYCNGCGPRATATPDPLTGCNCRWKGDTQVEWCEHHRAHLDAIHEWAQRAKSAEAKLKATPEPVGEPFVATYSSESIGGKQHDTGRVNKGPRGGFFASTASHEDARLIAAALNAYTRPAAAPDTVPLDALHAVERERDYWKSRSKAMGDHAEGTCWYWMGDGEDHLESLVNSLPVVIRADQLRDLLARPAPGVPDVEDLRDRLVAISAAVADSDDRAAQAMLGEILRALAAAQAKGGGNG